MTFDYRDHAKARAQIAGRQEAAQRNGYSLEYHPTTKVRGWPAPSARPFQLRTREGAYIASYETFDALERGFDARAGL
jgi:hypothetical protein